MLTQSSARPQFTGVTDYLSWDHERLDALWAEVCQMVSDGELERAGAYFLEFHDGLLRHIRIEEDILFPAFERVTGLTSGPTLTMRSEHVDLREWLDAAEAALDRLDAKSFETVRQSFTGLMARHNLKAERYLYRGADQALGAERAALVARMERA